MSVITTVKELLQSTEPADRSDLSVKQSKGAYWCRDCDERISEVNAAVEGEGTPACPDCGDGMEFEPSPPTAGCGC